MDQERTVLETESKRVTAVELVHDALRDAILRGALPGDARLIQTNIAKQLGVSTTPVREAMRELASDGLITLDSHRVGIVRSPDWHEMQEIVSMRHSLMPTAIEWAMASINENQLAEARTLAEQMDQEGIDLGTWVHMNIEFHRIFHEATDTVRLAPTLISLESAAGVFVAQAQRLHPEIRQRGIEDHFAFVEAFEQKDAEKALVIDRGHVTLPLTATELAAPASA